MSEAYQGVTLRFVPTPAKSKVKRCCASKSVVQNLMRYFLIQYPGFVGNLGMDGQELAPVASSRTLAVDIMSSRRWSFKIIGIICSLLMFMLVLM